MEENDKAERRRRIANGSHNIDDYLALANLLISDGRDDEAISTCRHALKLPLGPFEKAKVSVELGWIFFEIGQDAEATALAQTTLEILSGEQESAGVLACRGKAHSVLALTIWWSATHADAAKAKDLARAGIDCYERIIDSTPDFADIGEIYFAVAQLYDLIGNNKLAIKFCDKSLKQDLGERQQIACLNLLAGCFQSEGQFAEAEKSLKEALLLARADDGTLPSLYFTQGLIQRSLNDFLAARESFQKSLESLKGHRYLRDDPTLTSDIYSNLGELEYYLENPHGALHAFEKTLDYHPDDDPDRRNALLWIAWCHQAVGDYQSAIEYFKRILDSPNISEREKGLAKSGLSWNLGKDYYAKESYEEAAELFEEVLGYQRDDDHDRYNTLLLLGHCYFASGQFGKARKCYSQVTHSPHALERDKDFAREALSHLKTS